MYVYMFMCVSVFEIKLWVAVFHIYSLLAAISSVFPLFTYLFSCD